RRLQGQLAHVYADLLNELWKPTKETVAPVLFKKKLDKLNPFFAGYHQHDVQELLVFLLDGLHEDLNRVAKKPHLEHPNGEG
ncbi:unnamed protein product, partial [Ascophyllum nodosum]